MNLDRYIYIIIPTCNGEIFGEASFFTSPQLINSCLNFIDYEHIVYRIDLYTKNMEEML